MNDYKITQQVKRKSKRFAKPLSIFMVVMAVVLVILAIIFDTGLMLPAFLFAVLYYIFSINTDREYEYCLKNGVLTAANLSRSKEQSRPKQEDPSGYLSPTNIGGTERQQDDSQLSDWEREWKNRVMNRSKENSNDD